MFVIQGDGRWPHLLHGALSMVPKTGPDPLTTASSHIYIYTLPDAQISGKQLCDATTEYTHTQTGSERGLSVL